MIYSPIRSLNAKVNGHPASIMYVPEYVTDENNVSQAAFVTVTKIDNYIILMAFAPRPAYDATETFMTILSSMTIDGVEGGESDINKVIRCQIALYSCMSQCWFSFSEMRDESVLRP